MFEDQVLDHVSDELMTVIPSITEVEWTGNLDEDFRRAVGNFNFMCDFAAFCSSFDENDVDIVSVVPDVPDVVDLTCDEESENDYNIANDTAASYDRNGNRIIVVVDLTNE